jgi:replicative DNA helicase
MAEESQEIQMEDYFQTTLNDYNEFDELAWNKGDGYNLPNYPIFTEKLEGMEAGMYLFAAESNVGKSAMMMNMMFDAATCPENKLFGIYYSLDDSKFEIIPRIIAMDQLIPIAVASKPKRYQNMIDNAEENSDIYLSMLAKRLTGLENLRKKNNLFKIEDSSKIKCAEDMYEHMQMIQTYVKSLDPEANIIVGIDAINDIKFRDKHFESISKENAEIARTVKDWTVQLNIPIFASVHLRKINQNRRPTLDDLANSIEYVYESSVVFLLFNDVSKNKNSAKIYYNHDDYEYKLPIIEMDWAKNKKSSYKGRTYNYFSPEYSKAQECDADVTKRYDALIYEI